MGLRRRDLLAIKQPRTRMDRAKMTLIWLLVALIGLAATDMLSSLVYRTSEVARAVVLPAAPGPDVTAIVIFPGYVMSGSLVARGFRPFFPDNYALVGVDYAQRGVAVDQIYREVATALERVRPRKVVFYGASMGGLVSSLSANLYKRDGAKYGPITLVLDSAPSSEKDVRRPRWALLLACHYPGGLLSSMLWAAAMKLSPMPPLGPGASERLVESSRQAGAWVGTPALTSQGCFIARTPGTSPRMDAAVIERVYYLRGDGPHLDPLIKTDQAINSWTIRDPHVTVKVVGGRDARWHLPLLEFPKQTSLTIQSCITD